VGFLCRFGPLHVDLCGSLVAAFDDLPGAVSHLRVAVAVVDPDCDALDSRRRSSSFTQQVMEKA
jgi:hypothetical protein